MVAVATGEGARDVTEAITGTEGAGAGEATLTTAVCTDEDEIGAAGFGIEALLPILIMDTFIFGGCVMVHCAVCKKNLQNNKYVLALW